VDFILGRVFTAEEGKFLGSGFSYGQRKNLGGPPPLRKVNF
jgi:hypothetical protein